MKMNEMEMNLEEMEMVNGGVMVEAYEVMATGIGKLTQWIYKLFH